MRQSIEQGRLAGVGVPDQCDRWHRRLASPFAELRAAHTYVLDGFAKSMNAGPNAASVGLELRFARAARADTSAESR